MDEDLKVLHEKYIEKIIDKPRYGGFRQGTVFSSFKFKNYEDCLCYGLVITAQCDLAQEKVDIINFLPVVNIKDWYLREFSQILIKNFQNELNQKFTDILKLLGVSETLLIIKSKEEIFEFLKSKHGQDKKLKNHLNKIEEIIGNTSYLDSITEKSVLTWDEFYKLVGINMKTSEKTYQKFVKQELSGYYFIPSLNIDIKDGFVVILRYVFNMSFGLSQIISNGADYKNLIDSDYSDEAGRILRFDLKNDLFSMPIAQVKPPFSEHLMQKFALLFTRIGVEDLNSEQIGIFKFPDGGKDEVSCC